MLSETLADQAFYPITSHCGFDKTFADGHAETGMIQPVMPRQDGEGVIRGAAFCSLEYPLEIGTTEQAIRFRKTLAYAFFGIASRLIFRHWLIRHLRYH